MEVLLITGSTIDEGRLAKGGDKFTDDYTMECASCWTSPVDFVSLCSPDKVKVTSSNGKHSIVVYTKCTDSVQPGQVFMPRAIWSNVVIDPDTLSTGSPLYKGAPVNIEPSEELTPAAWDEALERAADILVSAKRPLLFMGSETSCEAHEVGLKIGEYLGALVDSNATICHGPTAMGIQESGKVGATEGQKKNRGDLIVYWGTNPLESMPRQMSRYGLFPRGYWTKRGRFDRTVITDPRRTPTAVASDLHVQLKPNSDYELISALLTLLHGKTPHPSVEEIIGVPIPIMEEMLDIMKNCNFGAISVGLGLSSSIGKHRNAEIAMNLVKELNNYTIYFIFYI